jgi:membrane protein implicated in regulation of membrane protease activity
MLENPILSVLPLLFTVVVLVVLPLTILRIFLERKIQKRRKAAKEAEREDLARRIARHIKAN